MTTNAIASSTESCTSPFQFQPHLIDLSLPRRRCYAQTVVADLDNDGQMEFVMGQRHGNLYWYKRQADDSWSRHLLGRRSPSDVGACAIDVDGDGWIDIVTGGAWYQNSRDANRPWKRHVFDRRLKAVHDLLAADLDSDGQLEIVTMSDRNNLRWYKIPSDPTDLWHKRDIGPSVHAGLAAGDLNGDGTVDLVRSNIWLENVNGNGSVWVAHPLAPSSPPPEDFCPPYAYNATCSVVCDLNQDGKNDIVFTDAEIPGGKVWWLENLDGKGVHWQRHEIYSPAKGEPRRGAYHSLYVGDLDGDGDLDVFSCEMEAVSGEEPPRFYIWENVDGSGNRWREHVIFDENLGGHAAVVSDMTGSGTLDILTKPWHASRHNALKGQMYVLFLKNLGLKPPSGR